MIIKKVPPSHVCKAPEHIWYPGPIDTREYDHLYENFGKTDHFRWENWRNQYDCGQVEFIADITHQQIKSPAWLGFWFFKDRVDFRKINVQIGDLEHKLNPNCLLVCRDTDILKLAVRPMYNLHLPVVLIRFNEKYLRYFDSLFQD